MTGSPDGGPGQTSIVLPIKQFAPTHVSAVEIPNAPTTVDCLNLPWT